LRSLRLKAFYAALRKEIDLRRGGTVRKPHPTILLVCGFLRLVIGFLRDLCDLCG